MTSQAKTTGVLSQMKWIIKFSAKRVSKMDRVLRARQWVKVNILMMNMILQMIPMLSLRISTKVIRMMNLFEILKEVR